MSLTTALAICEGGVREKQEGLCDPSCFSLCW